MTTVIVECSVSMMGNMVWLILTNNALNYVATVITKLTCQQHILLHCKVIKTIILQYNVSYPCTHLTVSLQLTVNLTLLGVWLWNNKVSIQFHYVHKTSLVVLGETVFCLFSLCFWLFLWSYSGDKTIKAINMFWF